MKRPIFVAGLGVLATAGPVFAAPTGGDDGQLAAVGSEPTVTIPVLDNHAGAGVSWHDGFNFTSADEQSSMRIGGFFQFDGNWFSGDDGTEAFEEDALGFARSRLGVEGRASGVFGYRVVYDFAGGEAAFRDVYMTIDNFLVGSLKVGQFKEPFGLDELTAITDVTFMERGITTSVAPSRNVGAQVSDYYDDTNAGWQVGLFAGGIYDNTMSNAISVEGGYAVTGRVHWNPLLNEEGTELVHLGASYTMRSFDATTGFASGIEDGVSLSGFGAAIATGGASDAASGFNLEAAGVMGPASVQAEFVSSTFDGAGGNPDADVDGFYVQGSYILTGESRGYSRGIFQGVTPSSAWTGFSGDGTGAWEVALRLGTLDADAGGEFESLAAGVNWYMTNQARMAVNYIVSNFDAGAADVDINGLQLRLQHAF